MTKIRQKNKLNLMLIAGCVLLLASGCDKFKKKEPPHSAPPATAQPAVVKQVPVQVQKQISSVKLNPLVPSNQFDFSTKKDPFKPYAVVKTAQIAGAEPKGKNLPIYSFDVSQFKLVGVIADVRGGNKAMVVDPTGKAYVLKVGMAIGKSEGKVAKITTSGIDVVEHYREDNGRVRNETINIPLLRKP